MSDNFIHTSNRHTTNNERVYVIKVRPEYDAKKDKSTYNISLGYEGSDSYLRSNTTSLTEGIHDFCDEILVDQIRLKELKKKEKKNTNFELTLDNMMQVLNKAYNTNTELKTFSFDDVITITMQDQNKLFYCLEDVQEDVYLDFNQVLLFGFNNDTWTYEWYIGTLSIEIDESLLMNIKPYNIIRPYNINDITNLYEWGKTHQWGQFTGDNDVCTYTHWVASTKNKNTFIWQSRPGDGIVCHKNPETNLYEWKKIE